MAAGGDAEEVISMGIRIASAPSSISDAATCQRVAASQ